MYNLMTNHLILNEKDQREAKARLAKLTEALTSESILEKVVAGLPPEVVTQVTRMMEAEKKSIEEMIIAYEHAKATGEATELEERVGFDPGLVLIVARIAKGFTQKELAWRLGMKEQQIQRYEADRYSTISLKKYGRIAQLLGVRIEASINKIPELRGLDHMIADAPKSEIRKILKHGRENGWFPEETSEKQLREKIAENRIQYGSPSLLRTGLNVKDHSEDLLLHAWRARVSSVAAELIGTLEVKFDPLDLGWIRELVSLSVHEDGASRARDFLKQNGVLLIIERQIPGLAIDGACFLEEGVPVIGLTLRRDAIDNFWFTLLHELGHAVLHFRSGLSGGFFDDIDSKSDDDQEKEADAFAANLLIPEESWKRSPARISNSEKAIERFAAELGIHPAIVFGRIRKERDNYSLFAKKIGGKPVRRQMIG